MQDLFVSVKTGVCAGAARPYTSGAARRGKIPPYGWTSKNYVICVCFHCHGTSSASKCVSFWGTSYSRPHIDPYLTPPPRYKILAAPLSYTDWWPTGGNASSAPWYAGTSTPLKPGSRTLIGNSWGGGVVIFSWWRTVKITGAKYS